MLILSVAAAWFFLLRGFQKIKLHEVSGTKKTVEQTEEVNFICTNVFIIDIS